MGNLTSVLDGGEWSTSCPGHLPGKSHRYLLIGWEAC